MQVCSFYGNKPFETWFCWFSTPGPQNLKRKERIIMANEINETEEVTSAGISSEL